MKIGKGINGGWYLVFNDEEEADNTHGFSRKFFIDIVNVMEGIGTHIIFFNG